MNYRAPHKKGPPPAENDRELTWCPDCGRMDTWKHAGRKRTWAAALSYPVQDALTRWEGWITAPTGLVRRALEQLVSRVGGERSTYTPGCPVCENRPGERVCAACCWIHACTSCRDARWGPKDLHDPGSP